MNKTEYLQHIKNVIITKGYYTAYVMAEQQPSFAYTIGLTSKNGFELAFCGGANYNLNDFTTIIDGIVFKITRNDIIFDKYFEIEGYGKFKLHITDESWNKKILLGVYDLFNLDSIIAYQIIPEEKNKLLDVPNMSLKWDDKNPIWRWLEDEWTYPIPLDSIIITNIKALRGESITEITRWGINEWEMFAGAGPDVKQEEIRIVPFGTLLGIDNRIEPAINLEVEKGLWREDGDSEWNEWG